LQQIQKETPALADGNAKSRRKNVPPCEAGAKAAAEPRMEARRASFMVKSLFFLPEKGE
jgi:hypothetical protein